jgi:hypothetical protein
MPPPAASPLTAAITGFSQSSTALTSTCQPVAITRAISPWIWSGTPAGRGGSVVVDRSAPLQNAR